MMSEWAAQPSRTQDPRRSCSPGRSTPGDRRVRRWLPAHCSSLGPTGSRRSRADHGRHPCRQQRRVPRGRGSLGRHAGGLSFVQRARKTGARREAIQTADWLSTLRLPTDSRGRALVAIGALGVAKRSEHLEHPSRVLRGSVWGLSQAKRILLGHRRTHQLESRDPKQRSVPRAESREPAFAASPRWGQARAPLGL